MKEKETASWLQVSTLATISAGLRRLEILLLIVTYVVKVIDLMTLGKLTTLFRAIRTRP